MCRHSGEPSDLLPDTDCDGSSGFATDGDGNGVADPWEWRDATHSAARKLLFDGVRDDVNQAVRRYNNDAVYVEQVRRMASEYARVTAAVAVDAGPERQAIIQRAYSWLNANCPETPALQVDHETMNCGMPYSQAATRDGWRTDCSGYVSMAWNLDRPEIPTGADTVALGSTYAVPIDKEELLPGDILLKPDPGNLGHVVLFEGWANDEHTEYWGLEQAGSPDETVRRRIPYPYFSPNYVPYRSNHLA